MEATRAAVSARRRRRAGGTLAVVVVAVGFALGGSASALPGPTEKVSVSSAGVPAAGDSEAAPAVSVDGRYVAFASHAPNLVPAKTVHGLNVYLRDRVAGTTELVSQATDGTPGNSGAISGYAPAISADGRYVAFESAATNLVADDTNGVTDIFLRDRVAGTTERVSVTGSGAQVAAGSTHPSVSGDGNRVAFQSVSEDLAPGAADNNSIDVFVHDRTTGSTTLASPGTPRFGGNSVEPDISANGRFVAFVGPCELVAVGACTAQQAPQIFVRDLQAGVTNEATFGREGAAGKNNPDISADGRVVAFEGYGTDLVPLDTNTGDAYAVDTATGIVTRVSVDSAGVPGNDSSASGLQGPAISDDGRLVAFESFASNLVAGDTNGVRDVFVHDLATGTTTRESVDSAGVQANAASTGSAISGDGHWVGFISSATNLVPQDPGVRDTFVHQLSAPATTTTTATTETSTSISTTVTSSTTTLPPSTSTSTTVSPTTSTTAPTGDVLAVCQTLHNAQTTADRSYDLAEAELRAAVDQNPADADRINAQLTALHEARLAETAALSALLAQSGCAG